MGTFLGDDKMAEKFKKNVYQFKITLKDIEPKIWRIIQVPEEYSFWDLHVAIQDVMGWTDSHLHQFRILDPKDSEETLIGISNEDIYDRELPEIVSGRKKFIRDYFSLKPYNHCYYEYDFGDGWLHEVRLEKILPATSSLKYPICLAGERACPPEDCGGVGGYEHFLEIIHNPQHEEHKGTLEWVGGKFDSEKFSPQTVHFDNPKKRWKLAFEN